MDSPAPMKEKSLRRRFLIPRLFFRVSLIKEAIEVPLMWASSFSRL